MCYFVVCVCACVCVCAFNNKLCVLVIGPNIGFGAYFRMLCPHLVLRSCPMSKGVHVEKSVRRLERVGEGEWLAYMKEQKQRLPKRIRVSSHTAGKRLFVCHIQCSESLEHRELNL